MGSGEGRGEWRFWLTLLFWLVSLVGIAGTILLMWQSNLPRVTAASASVMLLVLSGYHTVAIWRAPVEQRQPDYDRIAQLERDLLTD